MQKTKKIMNKRTKKRNKYNEDILVFIHNKYGYSIDYIRKSLRGDRVGEMPDIIIKEYKALEKASKDAIIIKADHLKPKL